MKDIILSREEINNLELLKKDSYGAYGKIVKYKDEALKIYHHKIDKLLLSHLKKNIKRESNIIIYPECFVYENYINDNNIRGTYMKKASGTHMLDFKNDIKDDKVILTFDEFLCYYNIFLNELEKEEVLIRDLKPEQIFFDKKFVLTDSDSFDDIRDFSVKFYINLYDCKNIYEANLFNINTVMEKYLKENFYKDIDASDNELKDRNYIYSLLKQIKLKENVKTFNNLCRK